MKYKIVEIFNSIKEAQALYDIMADDGWRFKATLAASLSENANYSVYLFEKEEPPLYVIPESSDDTYHRTAITLDTEINTFQSGSI